MTKEGERDFEKQDEVTPKEKKARADEDALQSTRKAGELEKERLEKVKAEREKLGHLSVFSLGGGSRLEIVDHAASAGREVFGFQPSEALEVDAREESRKLAAGRPENRKVVPDEYERLARVTYPSGLSADITYEKPGQNAQPQEIKLSNGTTLRKNPDGSWHQLANDSGITLTVYRALEVSSDGTIRFADEQHVVSWTAVGTTIVTDQQARLSKVTYPSGLSAEVSYDKPGKGGQPATVSLSNETTIVKNPDGTWSQRANRSGMILADYLDVRVSGDGMLRFDGEGYAISWNPDGSTTTTDQYDRLHKVTYASGLAAEVTYAEQRKDAQPATIKLSNDTMLERNQDGSWSQTAARSGALLTQYKDVQVAGDGTISFGAEGYTVVWRPDGTSIATDLATGQMTCLQADGSRVKVAAPRANK